MLIGLDNLEKTFKRLIKEKKLSHSYIFFGEPQVGKYSFSLALSSLLERDKFEEVEVENDLPKYILEETLIIKPEEGSIGIDTVRDIKYFLSQKPVHSDYRIVIIDGAHVLTQHAQHAILKIAEEPPANSLLILIAPNTDSLIGTLQSRFQKIHFPRSKTEEITKMLEKHHNLDKKRASDIATLSLGRPGRAIALTTNEDAKNRFKTALALLSKKTQKKQIIEGLLENQDEVYPLFTEVIAKLANDPIKNYDTLRSITERMTVMSQFSVNKRLQLETALWNI